MYVAALGATVVLGLASRRYAAHLPPLVADNAGDALWALMLFIGIGLLAPGWSTLSVAGAALAGCLLVELSQLYHAPWIDAVRRTRLGGLVLGYGFLWSDLPRYAIGVAAGALVEAGVRRTMTVKAGG